MSTHSKKQSGEGPGHGLSDVEAHKDKSNRSGTGGKVAQVDVFPHDEWEDLDIERGVFKAPAAPQPTDSAVAKHRKAMLIAALVGCLIIALALGLGLGLGLKKPTKTVRHIHAAVAVKGAVGPKSAPAGTAASKLAVNDASQLKALMGFKAAVDGTDILKGDWTPSTGSGYKYCSWKYVICDTTGRVVEGINMTTDTYEVVFSGQLPPASVLKGLPGLREIDIRLHMLKGELPSDWSELTQLELIRLDQNAISGELPPSWSKLTRLRTLTLWDNRITGEIPDSWGDLQSLEILDLSYNRLTGPLPEAFAAMGSLRELLIDVNQLSGPLPEAWASLPNLQKIFLSENQLTGPLPESWGDIQGLTDLWVEYNKLSGPLPASLGDLKQLARLSINDNNFSGTLPSSWGGMSKLEKLYAYNNPKLSGCVPSALKDQLQLSFGFALKDYVEEGTLIKGYCKA